MAGLTFDFDGADLSLEEIANIPDSILNEMLIAQAKIIAEEQRKNAKSMLDEKGYSTGDTAKSIRVGNPQKGKNKRTIDIKFSGKRRDKKRAAEIAYLNEYGVPGKGIPARQFIRIANERAMDRSIEVAEGIYDNYLKSKKL